MGSGAVTLRLLVVILAPIAIVACSGDERASSQAAADNSTATALPHPPSYEAALPEAMRPMIGKPFKGDLDQLIQRRLIRVAAPFNRTFYYLDGEVARGLSYE